MPDYYTEAKKFWTSQKQYPEHFKKHQKRRFLDVQSVAHCLETYDSIIDVGCGDGFVSTTIATFSPDKKFYLFDYCESFINQIKEKLEKTSVKNVFAKWADVTKEQLPEASAAIMLGVMPYIFDDDILVSLFGRLSGKLVLRSPCTQKKEDEVICKNSEELGGKYAAKYRTFPTTASILSIHYKIIDCFRAWPDDIESKYGTKQFFFVCEKR